MGLPILCAENVLNDVQFPAHVVTANEEAAGAEVWHLGNGRRSASDYWAPTTANNIAWARSVFDAPRSVNFVALDRGHNLAGENVQVWVTDAATDFSGAKTVAVNATIPSATATGDLDDTNGIVTEDGTWVKRFTTLTSQDAVQLYLPAMGAGLTPLVVGCWIGNSLEFARPFDLPWDEDSFEGVVQETESDAGWFGRGPITKRRRGEIGIRFVSDAEYTTARPHLQAFGLGKPTWLIYDQAVADRAVLALHRGRLGAQYTDGWWAKRRTLLEWVEWEPAA